MRGLKQKVRSENLTCVRSHLLQMRGLKRKCNKHGCPDREVASFTDAWIETMGIAGFSVHDVSHLLQMRGLKLCLTVEYKK